MIDPIILKEGILNYVENLLPKLPDCLENIQEQGRKYNQPIVSKDAGYFMYIITKILKPKRILEVGCNLGYSATWLGLAMPQYCILDTIEIDINIANKAEENFKKSGLSDRIYIHIGKALDILPTLDNEYDMIFLDAVKSEYIDYLEITLPKLRKGGVILADNVLWSGRVALPDIHLQDKNTKFLHEFNKYFMNHEQIIGTILTIGDGLAFGIKK
ncbi:MAG: O-methyltransferase [Candidatus Sericytochromatia bacterium]|nr:MAG: O-methyltransferase [Candidatus Sericytochromatia bacterium]